MKFFRMDLKKFIIGLVLVVIVVVSVLFISNLSNNPQETRCVITVSGSQYDVTKLTQSHSGGDVFERGTDMSNLFQEEHGNDFKKIEKYKI